MRPLHLCVALSMLSTGLLGTFALDLVPPDRAVPLAQGLASPPGSHVFVRALLERVRPLEGGAALAIATDCAGTRAPVFFPAGAPPNASFSLVLVRATVEVYRGAKELVVGAPEHVQPALEGALQVTPDEVVANWRALLCRPVALAGTVLWGHPRAADGRDVELGLLTSGSDLRVVAHSQSYLTLTLVPDARVTIVGVVATGDDGRSPVVHVRV